MFSYERQMTEGWPNAPVLANVGEVEAVNDRAMSSSVSGNPKRSSCRDWPMGTAASSRPRRCPQPDTCCAAPRSEPGPWVADTASAPTAPSTKANPDYYEDGFPYLDGLRSPDRQYPRRSRRLAAQRPTGP